MARIDALSEELCNDNTDRYLGKECKTIEVAWLEKQRIGRVKPCCPEKDSIK